jgi:hypothetical protein
MVEAGQLRRWNSDEDDDKDTLFLVIGPGGDDCRDVRWDILQDGEIRNWSTSVLNHWSELAQEPCNGPGTVV